MKIIITNDTLKSKTFKYYNRNQYIVLNPKDMIILNETSDPEEITYYRNLSSIGLRATIK